MLAPLWSPRVIRSLGPLKVSAAAPGLPRSGQVSQAQGHPGLGSKLSLGMFGTCWSGLYLSELEGSRAPPPHLGCLPPGSRAALPRTAFGSASVPAGPASSSGPRSGHSGPSPVCPAQPRTPPRPGSSLGAVGGQAERGCTWGSQRSPDPAPAALTSSSVLCISCRASSLASRMASRFSCR